MRATTTPTGIALHPMAVPVTHAMCLEIMKGRKGVTIETTGAGIGDPIMTMIATVTVMAREIGA